ncbi:hypothetical protein IJT93_03650 [bacterium]|nr:hypothetical protein [bacterium]
MGEWSCWECNAVNDADSEICASCGAEAPFAEPLSAGGPETGAEAETERSGSVYKSKNEETALQERMSALVHAVLNGEEDAQNFAEAMGEVFGDLDAFFTRLNEDLQGEEDHAAARMASRLNVSYSLFRLAWAQFADCSAENRQAADLGLLLAEQAFEALHWTADYLRRHKEPGGEHFRNMIGRAVEGFINGEIDRQAYAEAIAEADSYLRETVEEGRRLYFSALHEAEAFDGNNYKILLPVAESVERVGKKFGEAILAVHAG